MDLETENRLAAMLMREAAELRRRSEQEGVLAYLHKPNVRSRPNSRFLTATVRGVQQANRSVEVNEMWRVRQKELELDKQVKGTSKDKSSVDRSHRDGGSSRSPGRHASFDNSANASASCSSKRERYPEPEGLKDEELEEFLHSRTKRGRGAVGSRMDETGPYLLPHPDGEASLMHPERPAFLKSYESFDEEFHEERRKRSKKSHSSNSDKDHSEKRKSKEKSKRKSKEKSKHKKKKREEKKSKHHR